MSCSKLVRSRRRRERQPNLSRSKSARRRAKLKYKLGDEVLIENSRKGIIRFSGQVHFGSGHWYGVELLGDEMGKNNGKVGSQRYFKLAEKKGLFIQDDKIKCKMSKEKKIKKKRKKKLQTPKQDSNLQPSKKTIKFSPETETKNVPPIKKTTTTPNPILQNTRRTLSPFSLQNIRKCGRFVDTSAPDFDVNAPNSLSSVKRTSSGFNRMSELQTYADMYRSMSKEELHEEFVENATTGDTEELTNMLAVITEHNIPFDINFIDDSEHSLLYWAAYSGEADCVSLFIQNGANVNAQDDDGDAAILIASQYGYVDCVKLLIHNGADINLQDNDGNTASMWAERNGHTKCLNLLKNAVTMDKNR